MEKLVTQVNNFSRRKLLMKLLPLTIALSAICYYLNSIQLFANLFSLIAVCWLVHPYLINFEQETIDYSKYLKNQEVSYQLLIDKKKRKLKRYKKTKPIDLDKNRQEFIRLVEALKEVANCHDDFYLDFQRDLKRRIIIINDFAIMRKKLTIKYLKDDIRNLENRKKDVVATKHFVLQEAIPQG
jgi:hypothetical protein